jgi:hypothetical protein
MKNLTLLLLTFCFLISIQHISAQIKKDSTVVSKNAAYSIKSGNIKMEIDPKTGGRITSFKLGDYEFLVSRAKIPFAYGSTFWPSPQSAWNWPPPSVLDREPYSVEKKGETVVMTSGKDPKTGFQFVKEITPLDNNKINVTYSMINISNEVKKASPWEISRASKGGLLFFPAGETPVHRKSFETAPTETINGVVWYTDEKVRPKNDLLSISDGSEGWLAYAIDGKLLIKKYQDNKPGSFAPGEDEVCFYISHTADYIEIELQGKYETLNPGAKTDWQVQWLCAEIPSNIKVEKGSKELVDYVRSIVK